MLSTFLSQIQTYFSKYFVIGNFFPMLAFAVANGTAAYFIFPAWHSWIDANIFESSTGRTAFITTALVLTNVLAAYVLSSLNTFLRGVLEGKGWEPIAKLFVPVQNQRRQKLMDRLQEASMDIVDFRDGSRWGAELFTAREEGRIHHPGIKPTAGALTSIENQLQSLEALRNKDQPIPAGDVQACVDALVPLLKQNDADADRDLDVAHVRLTNLFDYASQRAHARYKYLQNEVNSNFGSQEIAATKMGNVANTIQSYALRRYRCNLELIWSNLQRLVHKDDNWQTALQESKTQLDFLVGCFWLTLISSIGWTIVLGFIEPSRVGFLLAALGGPLASYMWYRAAAEQYRSFADVAMTTLDVFRFDLLTELRLSLPADVEDERAIWESFDELSTYGENKNFRYQYPKKNES